jgi:hypothetical protein
MAVQAITVSTQSNPLPPILIQTACPLFRLPRELRDRVYMEALSSDDAITWPSATFHHNLAPALLRTCRAIYNESGAILYDSNTFVFSHPSDLNMFVNLMDQRHRHLIPSLFLRIRDRDVRLWTSYLGSTSPHRSLIADVPQLKAMWIWYRSSFWAREPAEGFRRWTTDPGVEHLTGILKDGILKEKGDAERIEVKLIVVHRLPRADVNELVQSYPEQLVARSNGDARTEFRKVNGVDVRLEFSAFEIPLPEAHG